MQVVYHGTTKEKAERIIFEKHMNPSVGDRHWLGDGVYFYRDFLYALRWIRCKNNSDEFLTEYSIISAELNVKKERIFSFFNIEHKLLFQTVLEQGKKKLKDMNLKDDIVDGAVLNIMFKKMKYGNDYDMVEAVFIHEDKSIAEYNSRLYYLPEVQICVKNVNVIENLQIREVVTEELERYLPIVDKFTTKASGVLSTKDMKYGTKKINKRYKG